MDIDVFADNKNSFCTISFLKVVELLLEYAGSQNNTFIIFAGLFVMGGSELGQPSDVVKDQDVTQELDKAVELSKSQQDDDKMIDLVDDNGLNVKLEIQTALLDEQKHNHLEIINSGHVATDLDKNVLAEVENIQEQSTDTGNHHLSVENDQERSQEDSSESAVGSEVSRESLVEAAVDSIKGVICTVENVIDGVICQADDTSDCGDKDSEAIGTGGQGDPKANSVSKKDVNKESCSDDEADSAGKGTEKDQIVKITDTEIGKNKVSKATDTETDRETSRAMQSLIQSIDQGTVIEIMEVGEHESSAVEESIGELTNLIAPDGKKIVIRSESNNSVLVIKNNLAKGKLQRDG